MALELLRTNKVDLILMDIMMPVMDGYETIRAIKGDKELKGIPVIAVTAKSLKSDKESASKPERMTIFQNLWITMS